MDTLIEVVQNLVNPDWIMANGGLLLVVFIVFAETGLLIGFFLPGDPLLFITGVLIAGSGEGAIPFDNPLFNLLFWAFLISIAAIVGNFLGYWFGRRFGSILANKEDSRLFKRSHLMSAQKFYEKQGGWAIILARFLPIVRTFAPVVAGMVKMDFKKFIYYNVIGAFIWVGSLTTIGYLLGENKWVQNNLEYVILGIVVASTFPVVFKLFLSKRETAVSR